MSTIRQFFMPKVSFGAVAFAFLFEFLSTPVFAERCFHTSFFGDTTRSVDTDEDLRSHYLQMLGYSTHIWIDEYRISRKIYILQQLRAEGYQFKIVLNPYWTFFKGRFVLLDDYTSRWASLRDVIIMHDLEIDAIYLIDEPYARAERSGYSLDEVSPTLLGLKGIVEKDFPQLAWWVIESHKYFDRYNSLSAVFDQVGFNCYGPFDACGSSKRKIDVGYQYHRILQKDQSASLITVPGVFSGSVQKTFGEGELSSLLDEYIDYSKRNKQVTGVVYFTYNSYVRKNGDNVIGVEQLPSIQSNLRRIKTKISCDNG